MKALVAFAFFCFNITGAQNLGRGLLKYDVRYEWYFQPKIVSGVVKPNRGAFNLKGNVKSVQAATYENLDSDDIYQLAFDATGDLQDWNVANRGEKEANGFLGALKKGFIKPELYDQTERTGYSIENGDILVAKFIFDKQNRLLEKWVEKDVTKYGYNEQGFIETETHGLTDARYNDSIFIKENTAMHMTKAARG